MKFSNLSKINRQAIIGAVSQNAYEMAHTRAANEILDNKFEFDQASKEDIESWLAEQTMDIESTDIEFVDSKNEQAELHRSDLREIADSLDQKTRQQLEALQESKEQRDEAIAKHVAEQRESLSKAIEQKREADKRLIESKQALATLSAQHKELMEKHMAAAQLVFERQQAMKAFEPQARQSAENISAHFRASSKDMFEHKGSPFDHPAKFALDRDRAFQRNLETMGDSARQARDPDVRERIEIEMQRQKSSYAVQQNSKIAGLTGQSRDGAIDAHELSEQAAAMRAAELDLKLEARGLKVDFSQGSAPDIRKIQEHEKLAGKLSADMENVRQHEFNENSKLSADDQMKQVTANLNSSGNQLNEAGRNVDQVADQVNTNTKLLERLQSNLKRIESQNAGAQLSNRMLDLVKEARERQVRIDEERELQKRQSHSQGMSRGI